LTSAQPEPGASKVFSPRLDTFLMALDEGEAPNFGSFCAFCYNPLPPGYTECDHCGQSTSKRAPIESLPPVMLEMHRRKMKRESLIVNSFAFFGLGLGLAIFLGMVAINVLLLEKALWFFLIAFFTFLIGSRVLAALFGGIIGDEIGFRYANKRLSEDWAAHVHERETGNAGGAPAAEAT
jgi:hypothetical protein